MPIKPTSYMQPKADESGSVGEKLSDAATQVKDKVSDLGRSAADKIDENRDAAASGLEKTASALHEKADSLAETESILYAPPEKAASLRLTLIKIS